MQLEAEKKKAVYVDVSQSLLVLTAHSYFPWQFAIVEVENEYFSVF